MTGSIGVAHFITCDVCFTEVEAAIKLRGASETTCVCFPCIRMANAIREGYEAEDKHPSAPRKS